VQGSVVDFLFPKGHKELNKHLISCLAKISDVRVVAYEDYFDQHFNDIPNVSVKKIKTLVTKKNVILSRVYALKNMLNINRILNWKDYDFIWINGFETITFTIGKKLIRNKKVYLVHHNNTDELANKVKRFFFDRYKNKVFHIVFEEFIKEYLIKEIGVEEDRVFVIPHPLNYQDTIGIRVDDKLCVGLSNSNDELTISDIIKRERESSIFKRDNIKLVLKSSGKHEGSQTLRIVRGHIAKEEYDDYIKRCAFVLVPFSLSCKNRTSGLIIDALSNEKIVIGSNIPIVRAYATAYQHICYIFNDIGEIPGIMLNSSRISQEARSEFKKFKYTHSDFVIIEEMKKMLEHMS